MRLELRYLLLATMIALSGCSRGEDPVGRAADKPTAKTVKVRVLDENGELTGVTTMKKVMKTDEQWKRLLTPEQYRIARGKGTEPAFCGNLQDHKEPGVYCCVCCGLPLFSSTAKFD
jgi:hypothetical protein